MKRLGTLAAVAFLACILLANYVTTEYGLIPVGFGLMATAGTYLAGATFVLRDTVQDGLGKLAVFGLIILGGGLSYFISDAFIATASACAFLVSETCDLLIYSPLRRRGYVRAALASNIVGAVVDTFLFLWIAGFPIADAWQGQVLGKLTITAAALALVLVYRAHRKAATA